MTDLNLNEAAEYIGITRSQLDKIIKNGKELRSFKITGHGNAYFVNKDEVDSWKNRKRERTVDLDRTDFLRAFRFAMDINYSGHTRTDFGTARQRSTTQAVENWTQGALAELALSKFIEQKFEVKLKLEFRVVGEGVIIGQDIVSVVRNRVENPPRKRISVKSGKENGMVLIVKPNEVENDDRVSDLYVFVRVFYPEDFIFRLLRNHSELSNMTDRIPDLGEVKAEIVGYCKKSELERRAVPEADIEEERYAKASGLLKNSDSDWQEFINSI